MKPWTWVALVLIAVGLAAFWGINRGPQEDKTPPPAPVEKVTLLNPTGPTVVPLAPLAAGKITGDLTVDVQYWKTNDEAVAALASNQADFAVLPLATAANIQANDIPLTLLGVHEWKVFYMVAAGQQPFNGFESLAGQEIYLPVGRGTTIDVLLRSALLKSGLDPEQDVKLVYSPPQEIVALFNAGKAVYAALPEPFVTMTVSGGKGRIVVDLQEYYGELADTKPRIPIAGLFVKTSFFATHPEETAEVIRQFQASLDWYADNADQAVDLSQDVLPVPKPVVLKSLDRAEFCWEPVKQCRDEVETFLVQMRELYPEGIKQLPNKGFYGE